MNDAAGGQDWAMPGGSSEPALGQVPDAVSAPYSAPGPAVLTAVAPAQAIPTYRSWQPGIIPLRPMGFGEFISVPFKAMRYNRAVVLGGPLLCVGASMLITAAALWLAFTDPSLGLVSPTDQFSGVQSSTVIVGIIALLAVVLADALSCALLAPGVARAVLGERITVGDAFKAMGPRVGQLLLLWLMSTAVLTLALGPGLVMWILGIQAGDDALMGIGFLLMMVLGLAVGLPVYIITAIARCVIMLERTGAIGSVRRTVGLIKGRFWWSVLIIFVTGMIIGFITGVVQQLMSFVAMIALVLGFTGEWVGIAVGVGVIVLSLVVTYVFTYAYMGSVYALVYIDARIRHEGFDLDLARAAEARHS
ncbi:hypothetical protein [Demequina sp.]|uniref:hypothetical protein n=1 Tax=Demequina sp. TaxID=2050685 RepID=UPI003D103657